MFLAIVIRLLYSQYENFKYSILRKRNVQNSQRLPIFWNELLLNHTAMHTFLSITPSPPQVRNVAFAFHQFYSLCFCLTDPRQTIGLTNSGLFPLSVFTASSYINSTYLDAPKARKGSGAHAWCPALRFSSWLQIDLGSSRTVGRVGTEGWTSDDMKEKFVIQYEISYSNDGTSWTKLPQVL